MGKPREAWGSEKAPGEGAAQLRPRGDRNELGKERGASPMHRIVGAEAQRVWCLRCSELGLPGVGAWPGARRVRRAGPVLGCVAGRLAGHEWVLLHLTPESVRKKQG